MELDKLLTQVEKAAGHLCKCAAAPQRGSSSPPPWRTVPARGCRYFHIVADDLDALLDKELNHRA